MRVRRIVFVVMVMAVVAAAVAFRGQLLALGGKAWSEAAGLITRFEGPGSETSGALVASGSVEARTLDIASPTGGRIVALHVAEGQQVARGDLIAELDTSLLEAQIAEAEAAVTVAQAQVALLRAGTRPVDLDVARAAVGQAKAARDAAYDGWQDALALVDAPSELDVRIVQAAATLQANTEQVAAAEAAATAADLEQQLWGRTVRALEQGFDVPLPGPGGGTTHIDAPPERRAYASLQWNLASQHAWETHAKYTAAVAARDAARQTLADLQNQRDEPLSLRGQADIAAARYTTSAAAVAAAEADVAVLEAGATPEQIAAAESLVAQARAAMAALQTKTTQARIVAPEAGVVTAVILKAGEVAAPAITIVRLADLAQVTLTVYVPEPRVGEIRVGQPVQIVVDSFPGQTFPGEISTIAGQAEFTPKNVQTREERATTVFAVKITTANPDTDLKPGMPADVYFDTAPLPDLQQHTGQTRRSASPQTQSVYTGVIEASEVHVAAEIGGRVVKVHVSEGETVTSGQVLAELDDEELAARRNQAMAAVATARAELARITAPPQSARITQAETRVRQAEAGLAAAQAALAAAQSQRDQPQLLDAQINAMRGQVRLATAAIDTAQAGLKAAQVLQESLPTPGSDEDRTRRAIYDQNVIAAQALVRAAQAQERGAKSALAQLLAIRENPIAAEAAVHRAEGEVAAAQAALVTAQALLAQVRAPAQPEAVGVAEARVAQAEAALAVLDASATRLAIRSPMTGTVTLQAIHAGEVAQPAATLFTIIDLKQIRLVIYVPTGQIGQVQLGQRATVLVDAYPTRAFTGQMIRIADQAEFTPKNVQTQEERVKTVFAVELSLENEEGLLRPGMPADAMLEP